MKKIRVIVIGIVCICLVVGYYYYLSNRDGASKEEELTEVQKVILKDLDGKGYPKTPREVVKFYNRILCCYYNEDYTEEEFKQLTEQAIKLMDAELADNNPEKQYYLRVQTEVESYHEKKRTINNASVCDSNDVKFATVDGAECAYVAASYFIKDSEGFSKSNQNYVLRKDADGRWKILAFELDKGDTTEDEQ